MPRRWIGTGTYELSCTRCGTTVQTTGSSYGATADDRDPRTGRLVADTFAFRGSDRGNSSRCRTCEREARRSRRTTGPRVPGSSRLVTERRFGVELELMFPSSQGRATIESALTAAGLTGWRAKGDGSLSGGNGWEVVSPILRGEQGHEDIRTACRVLRGLGARPNRSCGLHVHHEIRDLSVDQVKAFATAWAGHQDMIDGLVSPSRRGAYYCDRLSNSELSAIQACTDLRMVQALANRVSRYKALNLASYGRYGTAEVRQHQGTCDAEKINTWIKFGQALIAATAEGAVTTTPRSRMRDFLGQMGERLDETARTFLLGRTVEFGHSQV